MKIKGWAVIVLVLLLLGIVGHIEVLDIQRGYVP